MAILPYQSDDGRGWAIDYLPCGAIQPHVGEALVVTSGVFAKCGATTTPTYLSLYEADATLTSGTIIPCIRVTKDMIYKTTNSASISGVANGARVTLSSNADQVTGTTSSGVAEIVRRDGDAIGSAVYIRF